MDDEAEIVSGCGQKENKRLYKDCLMDVGDLQEAVSDVEEHSVKRQHQEQNGFPKMKIPHAGSCGTEHELHRAGSPHFLPAYQGLVSQDRWTVRGEERSPGPVLEYWVYLSNQHNLADCHINRPASASASPVPDRPHQSTPIPSSVSAISTTVNSTIRPSFKMETCSPIGLMCDANSSPTDPPISTFKSPYCSDQDPISAAAHLHLLGESLSLIGHHLQETDKIVCMSSSFSLLLDSLLCALAPLIGLTTHIPELRSCTQHTLASTLENIDYVMPGL